MRTPSQTTIKGNRFRVEKVTVHGEPHIVVVDDHADVTEINRYLQSGFSFATAVSYASYLSLLLFWANTTRNQVLTLTPRGAQSFMDFYRKEVNRSGNRTTERFLLRVCKGYWQFLQDQQAPEGNQDRNLWKDKMNPFSPTTSEKKPSRFRSWRRDALHGPEGGVVAPEDDPAADPGRHREEEGDWRPFHFIEEEDMLRLLQACSHPTVHFLLQLMWFTDVPLGERTSETMRHGWLGLNWEDVDFEQRTLTLLLPRHSETITLGMGGSLIENLRALQEKVGSQGAVWRKRNPSRAMNKEGVYGQLRRLHVKTGLQLSPSDFMHTVRLRRLLEKEQYYLARMYLDEHRLLCQKDFPVETEEESQRKALEALLRYRAARG